MFKFLKEVVSGSGSGLKDLPYNIGEPYASAWGSWVHYRGTSKDDGSPVSIFSLSGSSSQDRHLAAGRNGVKRLRTVRHPNILSFLHSTEVEGFDGPSQKHTIYIVTEPVMPLSEKLKELNLGGTQRDEYYAWGLHQIAKAVSFLNNDCKLVHGNVCVSSVVVTQTLDWKLHAFDVLSEFDANNEAANSPMLQFEWLVGSQYKPMELSKSEWTAIRKSPPWAIDAWGLGCLIYEIFSGLKLTKTEELRNTASIPKSLLPDYQRLLSSAPSRRMNPSKLIDNSALWDSFEPKSLQWLDETKYKSDAIVERPKAYFPNKLVETIQFMEILNLKDSVEKDSFFRKLPNIAEQLPREIVLKKLLPVLASSLEFGSAAAPALTVLLKMGAWLPPDQFNTKVLPTIVKLFASNDRAIRVSLLQHIDQFGDSLSSQIVDEQVFPHVATGFADTSAFLRELTLKSMLILAPKLSQRTLSGSLLKYLSKLQVDEEPAIRTNTTILLGNIASYMNEGTRKRVLINAFTVRALRDTFPPARSAGILALTVTSSYYDMTEIATRILPNVTVLTIDPNSDVRTKAFQALDQFLSIARQNHEKLTTGVESKVGDSTVVQANANSSLLSWAMSSLTQKGKSSDHAPIVNANSSTVSSATSNSSFVPDVQSTAPVRTASMSSFEQVAPPSPTRSADGWGDAEDGSVPDLGDEDGGWDDVDPFEEPKPTSLTNIQAAQKRPVSQPKQPAVNSSRPPPAMKSTIEDEDDPWGSVIAPVPKPATKTLNPKPASSSARNEDDLWGSIAAPAPKSTVKPLKPATVNDDSDPWAAIAAPPPTTRAKPLSSLGRGRGTKPSQPKLGAQRIDRTSSGSSGF